jgi:hypothetical protein
MLRCECRVVETEFSQRSWPKVFHHHVAVGDKPIEDSTSGALLEVQGNAFLVPVDAEEVRALAANERGPPATSVVAFAGLFDFDDASAHIAQKHCAVRTR